MALTDQQYTNIMNAYSETQARHRRELAHRHDIIAAAIPEYIAMEQSVPELGLAALRLRLAGEGSADNLREQIAAITKAKQDLLVAHGYPADYLEPTYDCPDCKDTGYVDGRKCHCLRQRETAILYDQSHLARLFDTNNFSLLRDDYYEGPDLQAFHTAVNTAHSFIEQFDSHYENLYFYGTVGTGKSFLSICIAKELIERGTQVLYFSSASLFDRMADNAFHRGRDTQADQSLRDDLYECDCLIIDDLGTEIANAFVLTSLFAILNTRELNRKSTIITTNLSLRELQERYSDRIFSRITNGFTLCKLTGRDIRVLQKVRKA